jgi:hypothetical protein
MLEVSRVQFRLEWKILDLDGKYCHFGLDPKIETSSIEGSCQETLNTLD